MGVPVSGLLKSGKEAVGLAKPALKWGKKVGKGVFDLLALYWGAQTINDLSGSLGGPHLGKTSSEQEAERQMYDRILGANAEAGLTNTITGERNLGRMLDDSDRFQARTNNYRTSQMNRARLELDNLLLGHERTLSKLAQPTVPSVQEIIAAMGDPLQ